MDPEIKGAKKRKSTTVTRIVKRKPERTTLIERALGSFNANTDTATQQNRLNKSTATGPPYTCALCNSWFFIGNKLKLHYVLNHDLSHCETCGSLFENETERLEHTERAHGGVRCEICKGEVGGSIWGHYDEHDAVACTFCGAVLSPKSDYLGHFVGTHKIRRSVGEVMSKLVVVDGRMFTCCLCGKTRGVDTFFGHMKSFHKITTTQLMNVLKKQDVRLSIDGTTEQERTENEIVPMKTPGKIFKMSCDVCDVRYNNLITAAFHHVYCQGKSQCPYCQHCFESDERRERHVRKNHTFPCPSCDNVSASETDVATHIATKHNLATCRYCETLLDPAETPTHASEKHKTTEMPETLLLDTTCLLCGTEIAPEIKSVFHHFTVAHSVAPKKLLGLLKPPRTSPKPPSVPTPSGIDTSQIELLFDPTVDAVTTCPLCGIADIAQVDYVNHAKERHRFRVVFEEFNCGVCSEVFLCRERFEEHVVAHGSGTEFDRSEGREEDETEVKCYECGDCFENYVSFKAHVETHQQILPHFVYKCTNCNVTFPTYSQIESHFLSDHPESKTYSCPQPGCHKTYKQLKYIKAHSSKPHVTTEKPESFVIEPCDICGALMKSVRSYNAHVLTKHRKEKLGFMCKICKERFQTTEQRKLHCATSHPGESGYVCRECGKGFVSKSGLYRHKKYHVQSFSSVCPYCNKEFTRRDSYNEHLLIHVGPKHQCPHCPKSFTQRSNLIRHVRIHTGTKPYSCQYCDKKFSDQGAKRSHERVHTKEEHCQCNTCGKTFTKWQKLKYHMRLHTGEGLVNCETCGKQFTNNYSLNEHKKIHDTQTLIMCECGRGFSSEKYLQRHQQNVHEPGEARYTCPICFKQINRKSGFRDHMTIHAGNKAFTCMLCGKSSYTRRTIRRHILTKHGIATELVDQHLHHSDQPINLEELLDEKNVLQVDLEDFEDINIDGVESDTDSETDPVTKRTKVREKAIKITDET